MGCGRRRAITIITRGTVNTVRAQSTGTAAGAAGAAGCAPAGRLVGTWPRIKPLKGGPHVESTAIVYFAGGESATAR